MTGCYHSQRHNWLFAIIHSAMIDWLLSFTVQRLTGCYNSQRHDWLIAIIHSAMIDWLLSFTAPWLTGCYHSQRHDWLLANIQSAMTVIDWLLSFTAPRLIAIIHGAYSDSYLLANILWYYSTVPLRWYAQCSSFLHFSIDLPTVCLFFDKHLFTMFIDTLNEQYSILYYFTNLHFAYLLVLTYISFNLRVNTANLNFANFMFTYFTIR